MFACLAQWFGVLASTVSCVVMLWGVMAVEAPTVVHGVAHESQPVPAAAMSITGLAAAAANQSVGFAASRTPLSISGQIVDERTGLPLVGAVVADGGTTTVSDAVGRFTLARGGAWLAAPALVTVDRSDYAQLRVSLAWGTDGVVLRMTRASGVSIHVIDELTREAVEGYALAVVSKVDQLAAEAGNAAAPWVRHAGAIHPSGVQWLGLEIGDYLVSVTPFGATYAPNSPVPIHIGPQHSVATILVTPSARTTVKVLDAEGRPASALKIEIDAQRAAGTIADRAGPAREPLTRFGHAFTGRDGEAVFLLPKGRDLVLSISAEGRRLLTAERSIGLLDHQRIELYLNRAVASGERADASLRPEVVAGDRGTPIASTGVNPMHGGARLEFAGTPGVAASSSGAEAGSSSSASGTGEGGVSSGAVGPVTGGPATGGLVTGNLLNANLSLGASGCVPCLNRRHGSFENLGGGTGIAMSTAGTFQLGGDLDWTVSGATPGTMLGFMLLGLGSAPVPVETLVPQCQGILHVRDPIAVLCPADAIGVTAATLWVPPDQGFCGVKVTGQYVEIVSGVCPVRMSDAGSIVIGN